MHYFGGFFYKMVVILCHSAVCSVATRLLFCGGKGTFLPYALCPFPSTSKQIQGKAL